VALHSQKGTHFIASFAVYAKHLFEKNKRLTEMLQLLTVFDFMMKYDLPLSLLRLLIQSDPLKKEHS